VTWLSEARAFLPGRAVALLRAGEGGEAPGVASEPGGASAPLIWLVILLVLILAAIWVAAGLFGLPSAQWFCDKALNSAAAVLGVLVPSLLAYRSMNKATAAKVAIAAQAAPAVAEPKEGA
jgi:hypothetical protein